MGIPSPLPMMASSSQGAPVRPDGDVCAAAVGEAEGILGSLGVEMPALSPPPVFPFPFTPYDIQKDFMRR